MADIDKLKIEIEASSTDAAKEVNRLADAMKNLKSVMGGKFNNPIKDIQKSAKSANGNNITPQDVGISTRAESKVKRLVSEKEKFFKKSQHIYFTILFRIYHYAKLPNIPRLFYTGKQMAFLFV